MTKEQVNKRTESLEYELPAQERLNYFTGQFLAERDFRDEQGYHLGKHRQHHRCLHGWGTVCGLRVVQHPAPECRDRFVIIEPGLAVDCCGREIVVREKVYVDLMKHLAPANGTPTRRGANLLISLCYTECKTELVPALYSECGGEETGCQANRVREGFAVEARRVEQLPEAPHYEPAGASLNWTTTLNLNQALRLALDPNGNRLFVLNSADAGQIMVYDAINHCLLRSIDIAARGVDLAIDPKGAFLYVIRYVAGAPGDYFLRVIDVQDLNKPLPVNDLPLSPGPLTNPPQLAVAAADGRVYVLDPNASPKKVIIWKTDINALVEDVKAAKYAEVPAGAAPRAIAVSPDGVWLFIAEAAEQEDKNHVKAAKVDTLTGTPVDHTISIAKKPLLLAVSGDGLRLFVATASKQVHAFRIQETPSLFPEIGSGVEAGPDKPVDLAASPAGKWVYVLLQDADANGSVRVIDAEKFKTKPEKAVADPVKVVANPQKLLLSADGRRLYSAGEGVDLQPCGGVSVLEINEDSCGEIFWRVLEGCPESPADACVPLAAIPNYTGGMILSEREIDNRIRPLAPSTETLRQVMLCALEAGFGRQGPESPQRPPKDSGSEADLTHIQLLSWKHDTEGNPLAKITLRNAQPGADPARGVVIGFNKAVQVFDPNDPQTKLIDRNVFQLLSPDPQAKEPHLLCQCPVVGSVIPVKITKRDPPGSDYVRIIEAEQVDDPLASAVAFLPRQESLEQIRTANELWVRLRGDFVKDEEGRAIDAAFVGAQLPTGHRQSGGRQGLQGGIFESWFRIKAQAEPVVTRIALNTATEEELISLPGVGAALAKKIITQRKKAPLKKVEDLLEVSGITENLLEKIRDRVTV